MQPILCIYGSWLNPFNVFIWTDAEDQIQQDEEELYHDEEMAIPKDVSDLDDAETYGVYSLRNMPK